MLKNALLIVVLGFVNCNIAYSQTPSYYHYTSSDGLASSTIYDILQDRNGLMWFATINGISKFDGKHFATFRTTDGLNSNSIISLLEGKNGELYVANYEKGINLIRNGRITSYCSQINGKSFAVSYLLRSTSKEGNQKLYAYRSWGAINTITEEKSSVLVTNSFSTAPGNINKLEVLPNGELVALTPTGLFSFRNEKLDRKQIVGLPDTTLYCLTPGEGNSYYVGSRGIIYLIDNNCVVRSYKIQSGSENSDVIALLRDKNKNIWFSIMNKGFFMIPFGSDRILDIGITMGLQNTLVNSYLEDNEGDIWLSTFGKGVYCLNNLYLKSYSERDGMSNNNVYSIVKDKSGKLLAGTFNGINVLEKGNFEMIKTNSHKTLTEYIYRIKNIENDFYVCGAFGDNEVRQITYKGMNLHLFNGPSFCLTSGGLNLYGAGGNFITIQKRVLAGKATSSRYFIFGNNSDINRINDIFEDTRKNVWIGSGNGLCKITNVSDQLSNWKRTFFPANRVLNSRINSIFEDEDSNVWFAGEKGIARINLWNDSAKTYIKLGGHDLSSATAIVSDSRKRMWVGNMKGLYLMSGDSVKLIDRQTGLPSDEVYSLFYDKVKNELFIGTGNGISILDVTLFDQYIPAAMDVRLENIRAGDSVYTSFTKLLFEPEQHNVYLKFGAISLSSPGSVKYKYQLNGIWAETTNDFLDFVSLEKGRYTLQILAKSQNSSWGKPCNLVFEIKPRYFETLWFKISRILSIILMGGFFIKWRLRVKNKKNVEELELSDRINELKHQALSAMMNPHFIFNSLNSVQYLINSGRNEEANNYIAMMAKLIRKNLETAGEGFIPLSEEISRLKLYLDLEKLRFQESFSYELFVANNVDSERVLIPNMIIQPFVENTLWHGIINSGSKGLVTISFSFQDIDVDSIPNRSLIIKVTDNGIGIKESRKHRKEDHISKGIQIIEERLRLLSKKMELPTLIMLEDLSNRSTFSHGTEVIISLPLPLYKIRKQE